MTKKTIASIVIAVIMLSIVLLILRTDVLKGFLTVIGEHVNSFLVTNELTESTNQKQMVKPFITEEKKEVLEELLPENPTNTEEEIERREKQLEELLNESNSKSSIKEKEAELEKLSN